MHGLVSFRKRYITGSFSAPSRAIVLIGLWRMPETSLRNMGEAIMAFATGGPLLSVVQELTGCRRIEPRGRSPLDWRSRCQRHGGGQAHQD